MAHCRSKDTGGRVTGEYSFVWALPGTPILATRSGHTLQSADSSSEMSQVKQPIV